MSALSFPSYRAILLGLFALCLAGVWGLAVYLRPLDGDLTRVGGYTENAFHWTKPQQTFTRNLFHISEKLEDYDRYYDVVVLGDSFSCDQEGRRFGWQNFFLKQTGLSMIVFDMRKFWPLEVLESPGFRKHPPRFFVFESVERYLYDRTAYFVDVPLGTPSPAKANPPLPLPKTDDAPLPLELQEDQSCLDTDYVLGYLNAVMQRRLHLNNQATKIPLQRGGLFSSPTDREMLLYFDEAAKKPLTDANFVKLRAGMLRLQSLVESNGFTRFLYLIAPDKTSLYAPYLTNASDSTCNLIAIAAQDDRLHLVRTDQILAQEIAAGTPDVYLPNDSHWGSVGHRLAAEGLTESLTSPRSLEKNKPGGK
jgi:hypothetical protein